MVHASFLYFLSLFGRLTTLCCILYAFFSVILSVPIFHRAVNANFPEISEMALDFDKEKEKIREFIKNFYAESEDGTKVRLNSFSLLEFSSSAEPPCNLNFAQGSASF